MGEGMAEEARVRAVAEEALRLLRRRLGDVEALFVFGSWARGGGGDWSDVDILAVADTAAGLPLLERFALSAELRGVDLFVYSYEEVAEMARRGNPLALSALVEGRPLLISERVRALSEELKAKYVRRGKTWVPKDAP